MDSCNIDQEIMLPFTTESNTADGHSTPVWGYADQSGGAVTVVTVDPDGVETTYTYGTDAALTRIAAGKYQLVLTPSKAGLWSWYPKSTGTVKGTEKRQFRVYATEP